MTFHKFIDLVRKTFSGERYFESLDSHDGEVFIWIKHLLTREESQRLRQFQKDHPDFTITLK